MNFNKELENIKKDQTEVKNTITGIKSTLERISSRLDITEERISELEEWWKSLKLNRKTEFFRGLRINQFCQHLDLRLSVSITLRKNIFVV